MILRNTILLTLCAAGVASAIRAEDAENPVYIDAKGGVISSSASADVKISTAEGSGDGVTLESDSTLVRSLTQVQSTVPVTVKMSAGQELKTAKLAIASGAQNMTVGDTVGVGTVVNKDSTGLTANVEDTGATLTVNANAILGSKALTKQGLGLFAALGTFSGGVSHQAGKALYRVVDEDITITPPAAGAVYSFSSSVEDGADLARDFTTSADLKDETVFQGTGFLPLDQMSVNGGSNVRLEAANIAQPDLTEDPIAYVDATAGSCIVGSNSIGVLKFDGGTFVSKLQVGVGNRRDDVHGAVYVNNGAQVKAICATNATWLLGQAGYAYLEVGGGDFGVVGNWQGGQNGQVGIVVTNGTFTHPVIGAKSQGVGAMSLGGSDSLAFLYVGEDGVLSGETFGSDVYMPMAGATDVVAVQMTVENGGSVDFGEHALVTDGSVKKNSSNSCRSIFNVNTAGEITAAGLKKGEGAAGLVDVQFNGGVWHFAAEGDVTFDYPIYSFANGVTLDVPAGCTATLASAIQSPTGNGIESIPFDTTLSGKKFVGPPAVLVTGDGHGASAIAEYDATTHEVTGFRVTGRGVGYRSPSAEVRYGNSTYQIDIPKTSVTTNLSGGLIKNGAGTLVLNGQNTYTGETCVNAGVLQLAEGATIDACSGLKINGGSLVDFAGQDLTFADFGGDGSGMITNGTATITSFVCDLAKVKLGQHDRLNLTNVVIAASATTHLLNATDADVDRSKSYVLYEFTREVPQDFPRIDAETYAAGLSGAWGIVIEGRKVILRYFDGSLFIYY